MNKKDIFSHVGSMQQLAYVRLVEYQEGRSTGLKAYQVKNGQLEYLVLGGKCLDIGELSYKGHNISFLSKPGLMGRNHFDTNGQEALRSIMGGFLFTCGFENICSPCSIQGKDYPMHGRIRTTPAEHCSAETSWKEDDYVITVSGQMREAELFGENMLLHRTIQTKLGEKSFLIQDEIENQSFRPEPMMLLYHFNIGYPLLTPKSKIIIPSKKVIPRDDWSKNHVEHWCNMDDPKPDEPEYVFIHELNSDAHGNTYAAVINEDLSMGVMLEFNKRYLPYFMEWKSISSGDYVVGLEPSNSSVYGRPYHESNGNLHMLEPFQKERIEIRVTVLDGYSDISRIKNLNKNNFK